MSNGRCPWLCNILHPAGYLVIRYGRRHRLHTQAWASALPSDMNRAMREASNSRTVTDTDSYASLFYGFLYCTVAGIGRTSDFLI